MEKKKKGKKLKIILFLELIVFISLFCILLSRNDYFGLFGEDKFIKDGKVVSEKQLNNPELSESFVAISATEKPADSNEVEKEAEEFEFEPHHTNNTKPRNLVKTTSINVSGKTLQKIADYKPKKIIDFGKGDAYTDVEGIVTFRGNNFRDNPCFGTATLKKNKFVDGWTKQTGSLVSEGRSWTGSGWTGQPLMMKWPAKVKEHMNMHDWAKKDDDLVEVIYACLDGKIYFLNLKNGKQTRPPMNLGFSFKGAGALDPRGYPIMYLGAGYDSSRGKSKVFIINLLDCSVMHTFGSADPFSLRGSLSYFDSSALVDAKTDTLIYPGENGILYLMKLGTKYDKENGTLSINPHKVVKWRYYGTRTSTQKYWAGMEDSAVVYKGYLFIQDNGGLMMCLDLNKLKLVWVQDCLDDSNGTPVFSVEDGKPYLYISTSFHLGWRSRTTANVPIWKLDAQTGKIIWKKEYNCASAEGVSGGVQSTIALGKNSLDDYIYVTVAKTEGQYNGVLACLKKEDGSVAWEHKSGYTWSSPVCVYAANGKGKVLYCNSSGKMYLLNGKNGKLHDTISVSGGNIESSPAVYESNVVVGTRACQIRCVRLT